MKDKKMIWANALALTTAVIWVVCSLFVVVFPGVSMLLMGWWMHGATMEGMMAFRVGVNDFLLGGVSLTISAWLTGFVLGWSLEYFEKRA
ncbi:MAG: hypothetical protein GXP43_03235 [bacterium]|nr:hypothetical protein [bacterium]